LPNNAPALLLVPQAAFSRDRGERGSMQRKPRNRNSIAVVAARCDDAVVRSVVCDSEQSAHRNSGRRESASRIILTERARLRETLRLIEDAGNVRLRGAPSCECQTRDAPGGGELPAAQVLVAALL
jgi:hypothetical protein